MPGEIAIIPRGVKIRVELRDGAARGYIRENYGAVSLARTRPVGANGLANQRDFLTPVAAFEDRRTRESVREIGGQSVGGRHRTLAARRDRLARELAPYKYDLHKSSWCSALYSFDHPDPSLYTVLTSPSASVPGTANADFVIFAPRAGSWARTRSAPLVPPQHHERVHGSGARRLRR